MLHVRFLLLCAFLISALSLVSAQPTGRGGNQPAFMQKARQLSRDGNLEAALAVYQEELKSNPNSTAAHNGAGVTLDLLGRTAEAKQHFQKLIDLATNDQQRISAWRGMAMSYAFDNDCAGATKYEELALEVSQSQGDAYQQGERANEAARVCIEAGNFDEAEALYRRGTALGLKETNIRPGRVALWKYRLEHALARLAIRRGNKSEAQKHVAAARAILDGNAEMAKDQEVYFPYLTGYVALWGGHYDKAIAELAKANQNDPFIQCLIGLAHEKRGDKESALAMYRKAATTTNHNPPAAFARPFATAKLKSM